MDKKLLVRRWTGFIIILMGWCILAWPFMQGYLLEYRQSDVMNTVMSEIDSGSKKETEDEEEEKADPKADPKADVLPGDEFYEACLQYNQEIAENGQRGLISTGSTESFPVDARTYGYSENVVGTIDVPRMDCTLPLYLGASSEHMASGAAVFGYTSVPMSVGSTNASIAGHRGFYGSNMFRDIQLMQIGDPIYIVTPWEELVYRVVDLKIVLPNDNSWCRIQEGRHLVSLMSCHPYTQHTHRYVVIAELTDEKIPEDEEKKRMNLETMDDAPRSVTQVDQDGSLSIVQVEPTKIDPDGTEFGSFWSNLNIFAEDQMRTAMYILAGLIAVLFLWLIVSTIKEVKDSRSRMDV